MTEKVERIGIRLFGRFGEFIETDSALREFVDDFGTLRRVRPFFPKLRCCWIKSAHLFGGIVGELQNAQLFSIRIKFVNKMRSDLDVTFIEIIFPEIGRAS